MPDENTYPLYDYLRQQGWQSLESWARGCLASGNDLDEWALFQLDLEHSFGNVDRQEFRNICRDCNDSPAMNDAMPHGLAEGMRRQLGLGKYHEKLQIKYTGTMSDDLWFNQVLKLSRLHNMYDDGRNKTSGLRPAELSEDDIRSKLRSTETADRFSEDMAHVRATLDTPKGIFWLSDATSLGGLSYASMTGAQLCELMETSGLFDKGPGEYLVVQIPAKDLPNLMIPTLFHARNYYFRANDKAVTNMGRTVNKLRYTTRDGLPELIHSTLVWKATFKIYPACRLVRGLMSYGNADWQMLIANTHREIGR